VSDTTESDPDGSSAVTVRWADPVNILKEFSARPFSADDLPPELAAYPAAYAATTGLDPSITLASAVCTAAAALSDDFQIVADSRTAWMQSARLWVVIIAPPGAGKSPAQRAMLAPLWAIQRELIDAHEAEMRAVGDSDNPPPRPRVVINDTTVEALSSVLTVTSRGLLLANDEFESWMGSLDAYRGSKGPSRDRGEFLRLFDGGPHTVERVQRGSVFVPNWGLSILSATTPAALSKLARHLPEDGLIQRFILVCAGRQCEPADSPGNVEAAREQYEQLIRRLYFAAPRAHKGKVPLSVAAASMFREWRAKNQMLQEAMGSISSAFESHLAKHPTLVLRIALTFHAAQVVSHDDAHARDPAAFPVSEQTMDRAIRFMGRATQHAMPVYLGMKGGSDAFELARDIGRVILARGSSVITRREITQGVRTFRSAEPHVQSAALRVLVDSAWVRPGEGGYTKAEPTRYDVNPVLFVRMAAEARRERERRAAVREMIADAVAERGQ
jgi:hypothetical protein